MERAWDTETGALRKQEEKSNVKERTRKILHWLLVCAPAPGMPRAALARTEHPVRIEKRFYGGDQPVIYYYEGVVIP